MRRKSKGIFGNSEEQQQSKSGSKIMLVSAALMAPFKQDGKHRLQESDDSLREKYIHEQCTVP